MKSPIVLALIVLPGAAACRPAVDHEGYPPGLDRPWSQPKLLSWSDGEASARGRVSHRERRRASWFAIDLDHGAAEIRVRIDTRKSYPRRQPPVELELMTERGRVLDATSSAIYPPMKLEHLEPGRYLIHVYTDHRDRHTDFRLRLRRRGSCCEEPPPPGCVWSKPGSGQSRGGGDSKNLGYAAPPCIRQPAALP